MQEFWIAAVPSDTAPDLRTSTPITKGFVMNLVKTRGVFAVLATVVLLTTSTSSHAKDLPFFNWFENSVNAEFLILPQTSIAVHGEHLVHRCGEPFTNQLSNTENTFTVPIDPV